MEGAEAAASTSDIKPPSDYPFVKYNVSTKAPEYTPEQYARHLQSEEWSKDETDYLVELVHSYQLRWIVIADRYDYNPAARMDGENTSLVPAVKDRTMEDMKARYYDVASKVMALNTPPSNMNGMEFDRYEKMTKFDPNQETLRKNLGALQLVRTKSDVDEEAILLVELRRILENEERFLAERKDLYSRLDAPISTGNSQIYQSSQGLNQLLQSLIQADKSKKRRTLPGSNEQAASSPAAATPSTAPAAQNAHRDSTTDTAAAAAAATAVAATPTASTPTTATDNKKKGSIALASGTNAANQSTRQLSAVEETKYGVQHHERLSSGVIFRSEKATKLIHAKSNVQSQKLSSALTHLDIGPRLTMPTEKVCREFERLITSVNLLLEGRKVLEKVDGEIKVLEATRAEREKREGIRASTSSGETKKGEDAETQAEAKTEAASENAPASNDAPSEDQAPTAPDTAAESITEAAGVDGADDTSAVMDGEEEKRISHKRSASVLSAKSDKSTKKARK